MFDEQGYAYDGDMYCSSCLPVSTSHDGVSIGGGETDSPSHCGGCGVPLECELTSDGVDYVADAVYDCLAVDSSRFFVTRPSGDGYYKNMLDCQVLEDWIELARSHSPNACQERAFKAFELAKKLSWHFTAQQDKFKEICSDLAEILE
jgi:hypothetical protein